MNKYFLYTQEKANIIEDYPESKKHIRPLKVFRQFRHIREFGWMKFDKIHLGSLNMHKNEGIEICYIVKGKYHWEVEGKEYTLFPGDSFITCPWETHGSPGAFLDPGTLYWIIISPNQFDKDSKLKLGDWSKLNNTQQEKLGEILKSKTLNVFKDVEIKTILSTINKEIESADFAYESRINTLIDELLIRCARNIQGVLCKSKTKPDFITELEKIILDNLNNSWTLSEMCKLLGIEATNLTNTLKIATGLTPINYVIALRIEQAKKILETSSKNVYTIGWDCGFNSPQHFSNTFKKLTGITPKEYRNRKFK